MSPARLTVALCFAGGLVILPPLAFAQAKAVESGSPRGGQQAASEPSRESGKAAPVGCARWAGREFIARYDPEGKTEACFNGCAVSLVEHQGSTGRWRMTSGSCKPQRRFVRVSRTVCESRREGNSITIDCDQPAPGQEADTPREDPPSQIQIWERVWAERRRQLDASRPCGADCSEPSVIAIDPKAVK
jgi:hypothetical protein